MVEGLCEFGLSMSQGSLAMLGQYLLVTQKSKKVPARPAGNWELKHAPIGMWLEGGWEMSIETLKWRGGYHHVGFPVSSLW